MNKNEMFGLVRTSSSRRAQVPLSGQIRLQEQALARGRTGTEGFPDDAAHVSGDQPHGREQGLAAQKIAAQYGGKQVARARIGGRKTLKGDQGQSPGAG